MLPRLRTFLSLITLLVLAACNDSTTEIPGLDVVSVDVAPDDNTITVGDSLVVHAYPKNEDGDVLGGRAITWTSSNTAVAQVTARVESAVVRAQSAGTVEITANVEGKEGKTTVTVVAAELEVATVEIVGGADTLMIGDQQRYDAVVRAADGTIIGGRTVTWHVSNPARLTIAGPADGSFVVATAHTAGPATLSASVEGKVTQRNLIVKAPVVPVATVRITGEGVISIYSDEQHQFNARAFAADGSELFGRAITWSSSNAAVATVNGDGRAQPHGIGSADITATVEGKTSTVALDVRTRITRIAVIPNMVILGAGESQAVTATAYDANNQPLQKTMTWTSSNEAVATVAADGRITAHAVGTAIVKPAAEGQEGWVDVRVVEWVSWNLAAVGEAAVPALLFTRTSTNGNGETVTTRVTARSGDVRMILIGSNSGRFELRFDATLETGSSTQFGSLIYSGTYQYDVQNTIVFHTYNGQVLTGRRFQDGSIVITGKLEADTPELTLTYRQ